MNTTTSLPADLKRDLLKTRDKQTGGPVSLPSWKKALMIRGALIGAAVAGFLTLIIFSYVASTEEFARPAFVVGVATAIAVVHGAIIGPIVTLVLSRGQANRYLKV